MLAEEMGLKKRKRLKPDAVSTIFVRTKPATEPGPSSSSTPVTTARKRAPTSSSIVATAPPKKRMAYEKRERLRASSYR